MRNKWSCLPIPPRSCSKPWPGRTFRISRPVRPMTRCASGSRNSPADNPGSFVPRVRLCAGNASDVGSREDMKRRSKMSRTLYISLNREIRGIELDKDRIFLAKLVAGHEQMAALAAQLGILSLSDFQSYSPDDLSDLADNSKQLPPESAQWFDPADALPAVRALQTHYVQVRFIPESRMRNSRRPPLDRTDDLLSELRDLEDILFGAVKAGAKFRLHIGF